MNWDTRVTRLLNIEIPIIQGGLAHLAYAELAAAVSEAGGLGQITAMSLPDPESLRGEIQKLRRLTSRPFGVNFAIGQHGRPYEHMLEVAIEEKAPVVSITGGNPAPLVERLRGTGIKTLVLISSVRQAQKAESLGVDAVMAVGQEGGGHLGRDDTGTMVLIPRVVDSVSIPVIASGGIGDGRGVMAAMALGAEGVEMGTRFIATRECVHAHPAYKQAILEGKETDTMVIKRTLGMPARTIRTPFAEQILEKEKQGAGYEQLKDMISGKSNRKYIYDGNPENGFGWAGQVIGLIDDIPTVEELFAKINREALEISKKWQRVIMP